MEIEKKIKENIRLEKEHNEVLLSLIISDKQLLKIAIQHHLIKVDEYGFGIYSENPISLWYNKQAVCEDSYIKMHIMMDYHGREKCIVCNKSESELVQEGK